jgi:hypothetical protein
MTIDLEDRVRAELARDAERAPLTVPEWEDVTVVANEPRPDRRWARTMSSAAALLLLAGAVVAVASRGDGSPAAGFVPPGQELALTELSMGDIPAADWPVDMGRVAKPGSVHVASVPGVGGWIMVYDALDYTEFSGTVHPFRCMAYAGAGICLPVETTINGGSSDGKRSQWVNVPSGASIVGYVDGNGQTFWQRPIGGLSMFPRVRTDGQFTAYAQNGTVLATVNFATAGPGRDMYGGLLDTFTPQQEDQLHYMTRDLTKACLQRAGATFPDDPMFPVMPTNADPGAWDTCVAATKAAIDKQFADWGGRLAPRPISTSTAAPANTAP